MGLAVRVIPTLLKRGNNLVKGQRFNPWRTVGVVEQAVRIHQARGVDELILLDVEATPKGGGPDFEAIGRLAECCFSPITVGGGVKSLEDVRRLLHAGADKVAICSWAVENPTRLKEIAGRFGCQAITVAIDVREGITYTRGGTYPISDAVTDAQFAEYWGAGEILLTSINREGTMEGYDLDLIRQVSEAVSIPVIAHGGCSGYEDMAAAVRAGASAVAAGALFQFTDSTPLEAARYLQKAGIEARVPA